MKNIVVTGGAGFIGSNLVKKLLEDKNNNIIVIDNFQTGNNKIDNVEYIELDIIRPDMASCLSYYEPDEIYHLACAASPPAYQANPIHTLHTCYIGTNNILNFVRCYKNKKIKVLFSSTSETYGDPLEHPQKETYTGNVTYYGSDRACYDEGKRVAETLCYEYQKLGVDVKIARIFNTFGPGMSLDDGRVVTNFIKQALNGEDITIYGSGNQTRSLCYIDDMIDGLIALMASDLKQPVNLGNDEEVFVNTIALLIHRELDSLSKIVNKPLPGNDPTRRKPDLTLAREKIGYNPKVHWFVGLKKTIEYFKSIV